VEGLRGKHIVDVCVGPSHVMAVTKTGLVYSWGCDELGQLGHRDSGSAPVVTKPSRVCSPLVTSGRHVAVHCGPLQVCRLIPLAIICTADHGDSCVI